MILSIEMLERIANESPPPLKVEEIESIRMAMLDPRKDINELKKKLESMVDAFKGRGALECWTPGVLAQIDDCFVKTYMERGEPIACLFFPSSGDNTNKFIEYCNNVDQVLRENASGAPRYAREYFGFYATWQMHRFRFPVPLGTASVVHALHLVASGIQRGMSEVSVSDPHPSCVALLRST